MSRFFIFVLMLYAILLMGGCPNNRSVQHVQPEHRPLPTTVDALKEHVASLRDELTRGEIALKHAREDALQTKIWIGVGLAVVAGLVLVALGIWTTRRILVEFGLGAFALAALGAVSAWLVPYMMWIGAGIALIVISVVVYMLANRERALKQVSLAVDDAKDSIPEFKLGYKRIFQSHIDTAMDRVVDSVRGVK